MSRDPARIDRMTTMLYRLWSRTPDQRMFQVVQNALTAIYKVRPKDYFYTEDGEVEFALEEALRELGLEP